MPAWFRDRTEPRDQGRLYAGRHVRVQSEQLKGERMMEQFDLRQRVADQSTPPLFAVPVTLVDPAIVEIVGFAGAEAMIIDAEHGTIGPETMRLMLAHARSTG